MSDVPRRVLRETLSDQLASPSTSECLDVATLAAWFDDSLSRPQRAIAESHASTCAHCQAMLAAMAKTAPPTPARVRWQAQAVRWLLPLAATLAIAVVVWRNIPRDVQSPAPPSVAQPALVAAAPASTAERAGSPNPQFLSRGGVGGGGVRDSKPAKQSPARTKERPVAAAPEEARDVAVSAPAPPSLEAPSAPLQQRLQAPPASVRTLAEAAPSVTLEKTASAQLDIVSPVRDARWRLRAGGIVERSSDGGATWVAQATGVSVTLTAGAAPSPTICWLVGPAGVVLLSTDGRTWQRVSVPEPVNLVSVRASDAANATVAAADGRTFTTADGGKTWR